MPHPLPVPADRTLARAREELASGDVLVARQRLRGLQSTFPHRLDVRAELAATHRAAGDVAQAGRWSYLCADRDDDEVQAFLRATTDPVSRVRAMRWSGPEDAAGPEAQARLVGLRTAAETATGRPVSWRADRPRPGAAPTTPGEVLGWTGCLLVVAVLAALVVIGAVTVVGWLR